jgi:hypothetical protein
MLLRYLRAPSKAILVAFYEGGKKMREKLAFYDFMKKVKEFS